MSGWSCCCWSGCGSDGGESGCEIGCGVCAPLHICAPRSRVSVSPPPSISLPLPFPRGVRVCSRKRRPAASIRQWRRQWLQPHRWSWSGRWPGLRTWLRQRLRRHRQPERPSGLARPPGVRRHSFAGHSSAAGRSFAAGHSCCTGPLRHREEEAVGEAVGIVCGIDRCCPARNRSWQSRPVVGGGSPPGAGICCLRCSSRS